MVFENANKFFIILNDQAFDFPVQNCVSLYVKKKKTIRIPLYLRMRCINFGPGECLQRKSEKVLKDYGWTVGQTVEPWKKVFSAQKLMKLFKK